MRYIFPRKGKDFMEMNLEITSTAFENDGMIPVAYSGNGENISPPFEIKGIAAEGRTIAIIMDDPDATIGVFTHWLIWNIPVRMSRIPADVPKKETVPSLDGACQGRNDANRVGYTGPRPPSGTHTYRIKAYVLDTNLDLHPGEGKAALQNAMEGHILQYGMLRGRFSH